MYSSQSQLIEQYVVYHFPSPGFFLEIGCWDGELLSQTAYLERERGWTGLCVDPFPINFEHRTCQVCAKAIGKDGARRNFIKVTIDRRYGGDVSYFSGFKETVMRSIHWPVIEQFCDYEEIEVETIRFAELSERYSLPAYIDFLSVDIEGAELEIFESIDFQTHTFGLIAFEHNMDQDIRYRIGKLLQGHGYELFEAWGYDDIYAFSHKKWLEQEYRQWVEALQSSTVHNFKAHPMVQRMLGEIDWPGPVPAGVNMELMTRIDNIGRGVPGEISGTALRMIYYAQQVLEQSPSSIVEIGGGAGQFYAVLRAMGYQGDYYIFDLPEVQAFQAAYLAEVERQTGLRFPQTLNYEFCVSFYALGEFDDELKSWYVEHVVKKCPHGFVIWNPHSGASDIISFPCAVTEENPLLYPGNKQLTW